MDGGAVLVDLLRFYEIQSWSTCGLLPAWPDDESETEELLAPEHKTLEEAVEFAPEAALQELAMYIGLDYDKIVLNREEEERLQEGRSALGKRGPTEAFRTAKREKASETPMREHTESGLMQPFTATTQKHKPSSMSFEGATVGWDTLRTEERTPPEKKPRFKDAPGYRQRTMSPTSLASSTESRLPTRSKS